ncbi:MAG: hypothetical protein PHN88_12250 [Ignavibacteria bacterium]|nr:hypothetical protein [Ignavibacteria bacterium]
MNILIDKYIKKMGHTKNDNLDVLIKSIGILVLFWISVLNVYVFPLGLDKVFFVFLLILFWVSKSNYFWFAFFIIIIYSPAGFFQESSAEDLRRLPIYNIFPRASLSIMDLFLIVALIKAFVKGKKPVFKDIIGMKSILLFAAYLSIISLFYGVSMKSFIGQPLRGMFFYTIFISFPALVNTKRDTTKFLYMFFPFVFQELFSQGYLLYTGEYIQSLFHADTVLIVYRDKLMYGSIRSLAPGYSIVVLAFVFSMILYDSADRMSPKPYLLIVMIICSISIFVSATRQSILMFAFMFILYVIFVTKSKPSFIVQLSIVLLLLLMIVDFTNILDLNYTLSASFNRLTGAVQYQNGTLEAEDTLEFRLMVRLPNLWNHIKQSLILGYGFSDLYFEYYDGHIGGIMIALLQSGITGLVLYFLYIVKIYRVVFSYIKRFGSNISITTTLKSLLVGISGLLFLNAFINPMFVLNFTSRPQEFFILLVLIYQYVNFGKLEYIIKKRLKEARVRYL